jgi:cell division initiation protein
LREIEMTLYKTLKTAEDTSTMITDQANQQAEKHIHETQLHSEKLLMDAQEKANGIVRKAEEQARYIKEEVLGDVKLLERDFRAMDHYKTNLLVQMRSLSTSTLEHVQRFEDKFDKEGVNAMFKEATSMLMFEEELVINEESEGSPVEGIINEEVQEILDPIAIINDEVIGGIPGLTPKTFKEELNITEVLLAEEGANEVGFQLPKGHNKSIIEEIEDSNDKIASKTTTNSFSSINNITDNQPADVQKNVGKSNFTKSDELEIIEGIGPKISILLNDTGIFTFRDLAITPVYKIQEILEKAGPQFARQDPSTWAQQAKLAAEGRWNELEDLKLCLVGGREPRNGEALEIEEPFIENPSKVKLISVTDEIIYAPKPLQIVAEESKSEVQVVEEFEKNVSSSSQSPIDNNLDSITEEMLEKVNKVKAAIRKAMVEKNETPVKDNSPLTTLNDVITKNESTSVGSFFDNL